MKLIEAIGPFHYEINGVNEAVEQAAADYLEDALDSLSHDYYGDFNARWQEAQYIAKIKFGVSIKIHEG